MCLAVPAKVLKINGEIGEIEMGGIKTKANLSLLEKVKPGDYVIVHTGFAIEILNEKEAQETFHLLNELFEEQA